MPVRSASGAAPQVPATAELHTAPTAADPAVAGARKGLIFGECGTESCANQARWISIHEARSAPQPFIYRCPSCCDRIDERMRP